MMLEAEQLFESLLIYSPAGIAILEGPDLRYVKINQNLADLNGYPVKYHIGKPLIEVLPDAKKNLIPVMRKIMKDGKAVLGREFSITLPKDHDKSISLIDYLFPIHDKHGKPIGIGAIVLDISKYKEAEEALKMSEERYRLLYTKTPVMMHSVDADNKLVDMNDHWLKEFGYNRDEVIGKNMLEFLTIESKRYALKVAEPDFWRTGYAYDIDYQFVKKNGEIMDISLSSVAEYDSKGKFKRSIAVLSNITERKRAENKLKESEDQLRNLSARIQLAREEERTEVAHEIHDELGQALTALKLDISSLINDLPHNVKKYSKKVKSITDLIDKTSDSVRRISTKLRPGVLDVLGLIPGIEWQSEEFQERTNIKCSVVSNIENIRLDKDVSTAVFRIFQEALTNVIRHSKATKVRVRLKQDKDIFELIISDNGVGITEEEKNNPASFGLIAMRARLYPWRGVLSIEGTEGKGTTLSVIVPNNE